MSSTFVLDEAVEVVEISSPWPAWAVPPEATGEWLRLRQAIDEHDSWLACEIEPDDWWVSKTTPAWAARQAASVLACAACPVVEECRAYAIAADERDGVWGGTTRAERRQIAGRSR